MCEDLCIHTPSIHTNATSIFSPFPPQTSLQASGLFSGSCVSAWCAVERVVTVPSHLSPLQSSYLTHSRVRVRVSVGVRVRVRVSVAEHNTSKMFVSKQKEALGFDTGCTY